MAPPWSVLGLVLSVVLVIFVADLIVLSVTERWWHHGLGVWTEILIDDAALSLLCAAVLVPVLRRWQRRAHLAERAMDIASDGFVVIDAQQRVVRTNEGYRTMLGRAGEPLAGRQLSDLAHRDSAAAIEEHLQAARRQGVNRSFAVQSRADGSSLPVQMTTAWLVDLRCYAAFVRDESTRVEAETRLRDQAAATRRLLDAMAEGVLGFDDQGRCSFANRSAARMLGLRSPAALVGRSVISFFAAAPAEGELAWLRAAEQLGSRELSMRRADGAVLAVDCSCHAVEHDDRTSGHVVTFFDIGERIHAQAERDRTARQLRDTFELAPVGMARIALDGRFVEVNGALQETLGRTRDQLLALHWQQVTRAEDIPPETAHIRRLLRGEVPSYSIEKRLLRGDRSSIWALQAVTLVRDAANRPDYLIAVAKDISARKQAEAAVRAADVALRANAAKTQFLSRMSHELRTPLNAVLGFAQLLRLDRQHPLPAEAAHRVQMIEQAGAHLLALIGDVLDLSRIEAGQLQVSPEVVDVAEVAAECGTMLRAQAHAKGVDVVLQGHGADGPPRALVRADRVRLRQVLLNLLSNAIKYNRAGGRASVEWEPRETHCSIRVVDNGLGMSDAQQAHLFEPFNRLGAEHSGVEGTGIGLVLARHLAQLMGGDLGVQSRRGVGTTVTLTLDAADPTCAGLDATRPTTLPAPLGHLRVLYAEDNEVNVEIVRGALQARPAFELRVAGSGSQALALARAEVPDLMLVDMHLGDTTGLELATALMADPRTRGIRLVALSADALPAQIDAAMRLGFEAYLTKPVDVAQLLRVLDGAAGG
ncbi:MAG TPA: PAS domain S-box protein [Burkholderiaceae bacterium]|nr:PAS domain S-box protein [Burkholderiaceae bacterium]